MRFLLLFIFLGGAGEAKEACELPQELTHWRVLLKVDAFYKPTNPHAGGLHELTFSKDKIKDVILRTKESAQGRYEYQRLDPAVGVIYLQLTQEFNIAQAKLIIACETDITGKFIYSQSKGTLKPNVRQNTGSYIITNIKE